MIIGICGYGYTGSGAAINLLEEYEDVQKFGGGRVNEFTLTYEPDGLMDLEHQLMRTPIKHLNGDMAILRFQRCAGFMKRRMNRATNNKFSDLTDSYINSLIQSEYKCRRLSDHKVNAFDMYFEKACTIMQTKLEKIFKCSVHLLRENNRYISVQPENFSEKTRDYITSVIYSGVNDRNKPILIDQPFPPNNPADVFDYYEDPYAIVVDRDPRDVYITVKYMAMSSGRFIPHDSVKDFAEYYKRVRTDSGINDNSKVLRVRFEDMIYEYDRTVRQIEDFLSLHEHTGKRKKFDPNVSIRNTQLKDIFNKCSDDIKYIEEHLKEYLYPFEKYRKPESREGIYDMAKW